MRIRWVLPEAYLAGGSKLIAIYAERLIARGHNVVVISSPRATPTWRERLRALRRRGEWLGRPARRPSHFDGTAVDHRVIESARPIVDEDVPDGDVVIATWWETAPMVAKLSAQKGAKAYLMMDYGAPGMELEKLIPTWQLPLHIITISNYLVDLIQRNVGEIPLDLVPCSVDTELFQCAERRKSKTARVGFLYRADWIKGGDIVLEAFRIARQEIPELELLTYGPRNEPGIKPFPAGAEYRAIPSDVELPGIYSSCDAWLFASRREGFGLPILEAMACGTPVIATRAGAAPELIASRGGGVMINHEDPNDMARAIVQLCSMEEAAWKQLSDAASATARDYSWDEATDRLEACLENLAAKGA